MTTLPPRLHLVMHILATFTKNNTVLSEDAHKTTSRIKLSKLSCIIGTLNSCLPWRCAVALVLDGRALAKQIEENLLVRVEALKAKTGRTQF